MTMFAATQDTYMKGYTTDSFAAEFVPGATEWGSEASQNWAPTWQSQQAPQYMSCDWDGQVQQQQQHWYSTEVQQQHCYKCGSEAAHTTAQVDPNTGAIYCVACWRQFEIEDAYTSDEDDDDDEEEAYAPKTLKFEGAYALKNRKATDAEDSASTAGSSDPGVISGDSDVESAHFDAADSDCTSDYMSAVSGDSDVEECEPDFPDVSYTISRETFLKHRAATVNSPTFLNLKHLQSQASCTVPEWRRVPATPGAPQPSATSFAAQMQLRRQRKLGASDEVETVSQDEVGRMTRALLNKLTTDTFESICAQVCALPLSSQDNLGALVSVIFIKATMDHTFCSLYARLCARLDLFLSANNTANIDQTDFCAALQLQCQSAFERDLIGDADATVLAGLEGDSLYEAEVKFKRSRVGNMRFLGELLTRGLVGDQVFLNVSKQLLAQTGDNGAAIESVVNLMQVIGGHFEHSASSIRSAIRDVCGSLFRQTTNKDLPSRMRFLIRDLLDQGLVSYSTKEPIAEVPFTPRCSRPSTETPPWRRRGVTMTWKPVAA